MRGAAPARPHPARRPVRARDNGPRAPGAHMRGAGAHDFPVRPADRFVMSDQCRPTKLILDQCRGAGRRCGRQRRQDAAVDGHQQTPQGARGPCRGEGRDGQAPLAAAPAAPAQSAATCPQGIVCTLPGSRSAAARRRRQGGQAPQHRRTGAAPAARYACRPARAAFSPLCAAAHALTCAIATARFSGSAMRLRPLSRPLRRRPSALHACEQYRTERLGVENILPHALQPTRSTLAASLSALAVHRLQ